MDHSAATLRILAVLPQFPFDPTSALPLELLGVCSALHAAGFAVRMLGNTATFRTDRLPAKTRLERSGVEGVRILPAKSGGRLRPEFHATHAGIPIRIVDAGNRLLGGWEQIHRQAFDLAVDSEIRDFEPDLLLTYCLSVNDSKRMQRARRQGLRVIEYPQELTKVADTDWKDATLPLDRLETPFFGAIASEPERLFLTFVDPSIENGVLAAIPLCEQLSLDRPDEPILIVASRFGAESLGHKMLETAAAAGYDLRRHENILLAEPASLPSEIWAPTNILVAPALRPMSVSLVAGALANGIPIVTSERAGLGGIAGVRVVPLPADFGLDSRRPLRLAEVEPWVEAITELLDDSLAYTQLSAEALASGARYSPERLAPKYEEFIRSVLAP